MFLTKDTVQQMSEDNLCKEVLIPLMKAMNFRDVTYVHGGSGEQGKDIICWKEDELGSRRNYALVVKAVKVTGKAKSAKGTAGEIVTQVQQCFGKPFLDPVTSEPEHVHQCWVISNKEINKEAEEAIRSSLTSISLERNIQFVDGDKLWSHIQRYLPFNALFNNFEDIAKTLDKIDTHYQPRVTVGANSNIHFDIVEKFPGAAKEKPLEFSTVFKFPPTPEGNEVRQAFERSFETGAPAEIPLQYLQSVELPDFLKPLVSLEAIQGGVLHIGEVISSPHIYAKITVTCADGEIAEIDYVDLAAKWVGQHQFTLVNRELGNPINIEITILPEQRSAQIKISSRVSESYNVFQLHHIFHVRSCLGKPCTVTIINRENNLPIFSQVMDGVGSHIEVSVLDELKDLIEIQNRVKIPINIPARELSEDERRSIAYLRTILHKPTWTKPWNYLDIEISPEGIEDFLSTVSDGDDLFFQISEEEKQELFGVIIPLGEVQLTYRHAKVENIGEIRGRKESMGSGEAITVHLVPSELESVVEINYLDWMIKE